jgi:hypothetical protein
MADGRFYDFPGDDRKYVSVTTFLGIIGKQQFLMPWAAKMERELIRRLSEQGKDLKEILEYLAPKQPYGYQLYNEDASEFGNKIHKAIDYTLKDLKLPKLNKAEKHVYDKWLEWWKAQEFELLGAEQVVKHEGLGYAGTMDAYVVKESKHLVLDWKTGKNHYWEHELQNYAYQHTLGLSVDGGMLVYIPKEKDIDDSHKLARVDDELMKPVLAALALWRAANRKPWKESNG